MQVINPQGEKKSNKLGLQASLYVYRAANAQVQDQDTRQLLFIFSFFFFLLQKSLVVLGLKIVGNILPVSYSQLLSISRPFHTLHWHLSVERWA